MDKEIYKFGSVSIWFEVLNAVDAYILSGPGLNNVTNLIELDGTASVGAPLVIDIHNNTAFIVVELKKAPGIL